jgi:hypothetical protein
MGNIKLLNAKVAAALGHKAAVVAALGHKAAAVAAREQQAAAADLPVVLAQRAAADRQVLALWPRALAVVGEKVAVLAPHAQVGRTLVQPHGPGALRALTVNARTVPMGQRAARPSVVRARKVGASEPIVVTPPIGYAIAQPMAVGATVVRRAAVTAVTGTSIVADAAMPGGPEPAFSISMTATTTGIATG